MKNPIFILGCPRSGTTMLASLLNNTDYGRPVETHFITKYYKKLESYGDLSNKENLFRLLRDILSERPVMQWKIKIDFDKFYDELEEFSYRYVVHELCMKMALKKGYKMWGDKTPCYLVDIDIIYELFPESKYIHIVRDGRDVALSLLERDWGPRNILSCAELWKSYNAPSSLIDELKNQKQLYFVRYEDMLDNADKILPEVYEFLEEEYDRKDLDKLIGKIKKGNYNKWNKKMNARQIKVFESVAANTLKRFGYETSYEESEVGVFTKALYEVHELFMRAKFLFKVNVIDGIKIKFFGKQPFAD